MRINSKPGFELDDQLISELWRFRNRFVAIKPEIGEDHDRKLFAEQLRRSRRVMMVRKRGRLVAMMNHNDWRWRDTEMVLETEFTFIAPAVRRGPISAMFVSWAHLRTWYAHKQAPGWLVGCTYLPGYVALSRAGDVRTLFDAPPGSDAHELLRAFLDRHPFSDEERRHGLVNQRTLPRDGAELEQRYRHLPIARYYLTRNPAWQSGTALAVAMPIRLGAVARVSARRMWRARRR